MKHAKVYSLIFLWVLVFGNFSPLQEAKAAAMDSAPGISTPEAQTISRILGRAGFFKEGVYKITFPRNDLHVIVEGIPIKPTLALVSWAAFQKIGTISLVMGDLALRREEVSPVLFDFEKQGFSVTALHNHLLNEKPRILFMHFSGKGDPGRLSRAIKHALSLTDTPLSISPISKNKAKIPERTQKAYHQIEQILGIHGIVNGGVLQIGIPVWQTYRGHDHTIVLPMMGTGTGLAFQATRTGVVATGDFALTRDKVKPVIHALLRSGIKITALHTHMLDIRPMLFYLHFWGNGTPKAIAKGVREALLEANRAPK